MRSPSLRIRAAYPVHRREEGGRLTWLCLLSCGHTVELPSLGGHQPRHGECDQCVDVVPASDEPWTDAVAVEAPRRPLARCGTEVPAPVYLTPAPQEAAAPRAPANRVRREAPRRRPRDDPRQLAFGFAC